MRTHAGKFFKAPEEPGVQAPLKVVIEAQAVAAPLLQWFAPRLTANKDMAYLVRTQAEVLGWAGLHPLPQLSDLCSDRGSGLGSIHFLSYQVR